MTAHKHTLAGIVSAVTGKRMVPCPDCNGTGVWRSKKYPKAAPVGCAECDATGLVEERNPEDLNPARERAASNADYALRLRKEAV